MIVVYQEKISVPFVFPFGARIVAQGCVPVKVGREKTGNT